MKFYNIKDEYINYLKKYDAKVADNKKGKRPYVGVVLEIEGIKYYTPFTLPKEKHRKMKNTKDFRKINQGIYGAINFNNMIPVVDSALLLIDIDAMEFYNIKDEYINYLKKYDTKVADNKNGRFKISAFASKSI